MQHIKEGDVDVSKYTYRDGLDVDVIIKGGGNFEVFSLVFHNHLGSDSDCSYRYGVILTIFGVGLVVGWFRTYNY